MEHEAEVAAVLESAFGRSAEAKMAPALRAAGAATISLIAGSRPSDRVRWPIVGHILFRPVTIEGAYEPLGLGLALLCANMVQGDPVVQAWLERGMALGNHTAQHLDLHRAQPEEWAADVQACHELLSRIVPGKGPVLPASLSSSGDD